MQSRCNPHPEYGFRPSRLFVRLDAFLLGTALETETVKDASRES